jgi:hypothetical protein
MKTLSYFAIASKSVMMSTFKYESFPLFVQFLSKKTTEYKEQITLGVVTNPNWGAMDEQIRGWQWNYDEYEEQMMTMKITEMKWQQSAGRFLQAFGKVRTPCEQRCKRRATTSLQSRDLLSLLLHSHHSSAGLLQPRWALKKDRFLNNENHC